jgi:polar amino acid transport system ATP-binding protein
MTTAVISPEPNTKLNEKSRGEEDRIASPALRFAGVVRRFAGGRGVGPVTLDLGRGQVCSLIGANGSGKTTLLRCAGLFESLDAGTIELEGRRWAIPTTGESQVIIDPAGLRGSVISVVFQNADPWPHLRVFDNVMLPLLHGLRLPQQEARARAEAELDRFGLTDRATAMSHQLSGGIRQRVVLARTFAMRPRILLLDEVTSALDPDWTEKVRQIIREFVDTGGAVISVSHRLNLVRRMSDWVVYLNDGRIIEDGPPQSVLDSPKDASLQRFLENA